MATNSFGEGFTIADGAQFTAADTTNSKSVTVARQGPSRIDTLVCTNTNALAHVVNVFYKDPSNVEHLLGSVSVPASQGLAGTPGVDLLAAVLPSTQPGILLPPGATISAGMAVTITAGNVWMTAFGGTL